MTGAADRGDLTRPLLGCSVVVTRSADQGPELVARLRAAGAEVVAAPTVRIVDADDGGARLRSAAADLDTYDWLVLTSPNGAVRFVEALGGKGLPGSVGVAVVGAGTATVLAERGVAVDLVPARAVAESLLEAFPDPPVHGGRVLLARAAVARDVLPEGLRERGWTVDVVDAYRTVAVDFDEPTRARVRGADAVTFTSSSTVTNFVAAMGGGDRATLDSPRLVVCIGPITAATARDAGFVVASEADPHSIEGLVAAVVDAWT